MIALLNCSTDVNVVSEGSPSLILRVLLISLGMTIRPKSSTRRTIPVAFIYLSPFLQGCRASLVQREVAARRADGGIAFIVHYNPPVSSADSPLYTRGPFPVPTIILQITMLLSVKAQRLYCSQKKNSFRRRSFLCFYALPSSLSINACRSADLMEPTALAMI